MAQLNQHYDDIHGSETVYRCSLCGWPSLNDSMREIHELVHTRVLSAVNRKNFKCPKCEDKWFQKYEYLLNHYVGKHTNLNAKLFKFKCDECELNLRITKPTRGI